MMDLSEALSGETVAARVKDSPSTSSLVLTSRVTWVTAMTLALTVTVQVAVFPPSVVLTVMVAVPAFTAVTLPLWSTVATAGAEEDQVTDVASPGDTVAESDWLSPSVRVMEEGLTLTPVTATVGGTFSHAANNRSVPASR